MRTQLYAVEGCDLRAVCISDFPDVMTKVPQTPLDTIEESGGTSCEEEDAKRQARRVKTREELAAMTDSDDDEYRKITLTANAKSATSRTTLRGARVRATSREKPASQSLKEL
mgnify:FL=1